jgi:hypothetical protein
MYLKAVAVGVGTGLLALILWVLWELLPLFVESARTWSSEVGYGGIGAVSVGLSDSAVLVGFLGFVGGVCWTIWRARRRRSAIAN